MSTLNSIQKQVTQIIRVSVSVHISGKLNNDPIKRFTYLVEIHQNGFTLRSPVKYNDCYMMIMYDDS